MEILGLVDIPLWLLLLLSFTLLLYVYGTWTYSTWSSQRIKGPKPWPLFGNSREIFKKTYFRVFSEWQQKYGRVVGYYAGVRPALMVTELDMLREIMVKYFNHFTDRNILPGLRPREVDMGLFFAKGAAWKRIRTTMTPTFSTGKLKLMSHYVHRCSDLLTKSLENKARSGQLIDVKDVFGSFTMDVIAGTGFGLETNSQTEEGEPFVQHCKGLFASIGLRGALRAILYLAYAFPILAPYVGMLGVSAFKTDHVEFFFAALETMINERREMNMNSTVKNGRKTVDLLQMLVEAEADPEDIHDKADDSDDSKNCRRMTKEEIKAQGFIMLIAGYETTASSLQYLAYNLALYPDVQEKVFEEIKDILGEDDPTYENVSELKYLDCVIHENLRMFPPVPLIDRKADEDLVIKGVKIPAGCGIAIPIYALMHDPEFFPEPHVFNPDRFLEENIRRLDPLLVELPFGHGPRKCIGIRLALLEIKFAAVRICRQFRFVKCAETPEKIRLGKLIGLSAPDVTIMVKAEIRSA